MYPIRVGGGLNKNNIFYIYFLGKEYNISKNNLNWEKISVGSGSYK